MAGLTDYGEGKAMDRLLVGTAYTPPSQIYMGLHAASPLESGIGFEIITGGITRQAISFGPYASRRIASNTSVTMTANADAGEAPYCAFYDAASGGNMLAYGQNTPVINLANGVSFVRNPGEVVIALNALQSGSGICPFLAQHILELLFLNTAKSLLPTLKAFLYSTQPDNEGAGGTELVASGYTSQACAFAAFSAGLTKMAADVAFTAAAPAPWGLVPGVVWKSGSNILARGSILPLPNVGLNAPFTLPAATNGIGLD